MARLFHHNHQLHRYLNLVFDFRVQNNVKKANHLVVRLLLKYKFNSRINEIVCTMYQFVSNNIQDAKIEFAPPLVYRFKTWLKIYHVVCFNSGISTSFFVAPKMRTYTKIRKFCCGDEWGLSIFQYLNWFSAKNSNFLFEFGGFQPLYL